VSELASKSKIELSSRDVAQVLSVSSRTISRYIAKGLLVARLQGPQRHAKIELSDFRVFAETYGFVVDEEVLAEIVARKRK